MGILLYRLTLLFFRLVNFIFFIFSFYLLVLIIVYAFFISNKIIR